MWKGVLSRDFFRFRSTHSFRIQLTAVVFKKRKSAFWPPTDMAGFGFRLEVHADVVPNTSQNTKRASFSSESANFSLSEKSGITSYGDDVSTRALSGSIGGGTRLVSREPHSRSSRRFPPTPVLVLLSSSEIVQKKINLKFFKKVTEIEI